MLVKAFVQEIINPYLVKVRIPPINKIEGVNGATPNDELPIASICSLPNIVTDVHPGDIVVLGFENNETSKPIVLGHLSTKADVESRTNIKCDDFVATGDVNLGKYTFIGDITPENIECLRNQTNNINDTFQILNQSIEELKNSVDTLKGSGDIANAKEVKTTNQDFFVPGGYCKYVSTGGTIDVSNVSVVQLGDKVNVSSITIDNTRDISITKEVTFISNETTASIQHGNGIHLLGGKDCSMKQFDTVTLIGCRISPLEIIWVEKCRSVSDT